MLKALLYTFYFCNIATIMDELEINENQLFSRLSEMLGQIDGNLNILEDQIDMDLQIEYFKFSKSIKEKIDRGEWTENIESNRLFDPKVEIEEKRKILAFLASYEDVESYRAIEQYCATAEPEIKDWAILALQESRMALQSILLEENQIFISTGLGGHNNCLRYFVVLIHKEEEVFNQLQQKIIKSEFESSFSSSEATIETISFTARFCMLKVLIPINEPVKELLLNSINEANLYGSFIRQNFIVTNVKELDVKEVEEFLKKNKNNDQQGDESEN